MSPITPGAAAVPPAEAILAERLLHDGEVILLAVKPSRWFVLLVSWPVLWAAFVVGLLAAFAGRAFLPNIPPAHITAVCAIVAFFRLMLAAVQWAGRWYILTNLRLVQVRGLFRADVVHHELARLSKTFVHAGAPARLFPSVGSLLFDTLDGTNRPPAWVHVSRPAEIEEIVDQAIRHARRSPS